MVVMVLLLYEGKQVWSRSVDPAILQVVDVSPANQNQPFCRWDLFDTIIKVYVVHLRENLCEC